MAASGTREEGTQFLHGFYAKKVCKTTHAYFNRKLSAFVQKKSVISQDNSGTPIRIQAIKGKKHLPFLSDNDLEEELKLEQAILMSSAELTSTRGVVVLSFQH